MPTTTASPDSALQQEERPPESDVGAPGSWRVVAGFFAVVLVGTWPTMLSFGPTWSASYQEQGFFLAALALWIGWRDRELIAGLVTRPLADLVGLAALTSFLWLLAVVMDVRTVHQLLFLGLLVVWAFTVLGWGARIPILTIGAVLALSIPVWGLASPTLQRLTTIVSGGITRMAGIQAEVGYDWIAISSGTFLVEEGCSGINYLMGGLTLGAFYAQLFTRRWQTQLKIVALAGIASIIGNWIRVTFLIFLGEATQMQSPMIEDHLWQGWAIFTLLMIPTYFLARRIELRDARRRDGSAEKVGAQALPADHDGATVSITPPSAERVRIARLATGAALVGPILYILVGAIPKGNDLDRDTTVFDLDPVWTVATASADDVWTPDFRGFDERSDWTVRVGDQSVEAARFFFVDQRQGEELIQYNNAIAPDSLLASNRVFGPVGPDRRIVQEAILFDDVGPRISWYWYRVAGFDTPFSTNAKLLEIVAFFRRSPAAELVTMSARCAPDDCTDAAKALRAAVGGPEVLEADSTGAADGAEPGG